MAFLIPDNIRTEHGLLIKTKLIPWGATWTKDSGSYKKGNKFKADKLLSGGTGKVQYVTIHNTSDIKEAQGTNDAEQYTRATWPNQNMGSVRVHYFIDETDCWQNLREDEVGWHSADSYKPNGGNNTSLAIEIIMDGSGKDYDVNAENRGALLAAILLHRYGLGIEQLVTHNHWGGRADKIVQGATKNCPLYILPHWDEFKEKVKKHLDTFKVEEENSKSEEPKGDHIVYKVQVGAFEKISNAQRLVAKLESVGIDCFMLRDDDDLYKVQVGAYSVKANSDVMLKRLQHLGYSGYIKEIEVKKEELPSKPEIVKGSRVKIIGTHYATGQRVPTWVKDAVHVVTAVGETKAQLGYPDGIRSWVYLKDLELAK